MLFQRANHSRTIPSLDGLRALSVALVILSHIRWLPSGNAALGRIADYMPPLGFFGVRVFFVISGYLITNLLIAERDRSGTVRLGRFYFRRTLRIFPAYYAMLAVVAWAAIAPGAHWGWLVAYASNFGPPQPVVLGHAWSLGVEEQFYLVWPVVVLIGGRKAGLRIALGAILIMPIVRVLAFLAFHAVTIAFILPEDFLAAGCALALVSERLAQSPTWQRLMTRRWVPLLLPLLAVYHVWFAESYRWRFAFDMTVGQPLCAAGIVVVVAWSVANAPRMLNWRPVRAIGVLSYSLYLWHYMVLRPDASYGLLTALVLIASISLLGYVLVERPGLWLRHWLETPSTTTAAGATEGV